MRKDASEVETVAADMAAGQNAVVAALIIALHENGILPQDSYSGVLQRLWSRMPEEAAVGESGAVIEQMLDLLSARAVTAFPSRTPAHQQEIPASRSALSCAMAG